MGTLHGVWGSSEQIVEVAFANGMENECHFKCGFASGGDLMRDLSEYMYNGN